MLTDGQFYSAFLFTLSIITGLATLVGIAFVTNRVWQFSQPIQEWLKSSWFARIIREVSTIIKGRNAAIWCVCSNLIHKLPETPPFSEREPTKNSYIFFESEKHLTSLAPTAYKVLEADKNVLPVVQISSTSNIFFPRAFLEALKAFLKFPIRPNRPIPY